MFDHAKHMKQQKVRKALKRKSLDKRQKLCSNTQGGCTFASASETFRVRFVTMQRCTSRVFQQSDQQGKNSGTALEERRLVRNKSMEIN
jgi:hypothetical protein